MRLCEPSQVWEGAAARDKGVQETSIIAALYFYAFTKAEMIRSRERGG